MSACSGKVIHQRNNYDLNVFNGDLAQIIIIDNEELTAIVAFYPDHREVHYYKEVIMELDLAYAITIHKSPKIKVNIILNLKR